MKNAIINGTYENLTINFNANQIHSYMYSSKSEIPITESTKIELKDNTKLILGTNPKFLLTINIEVGNIKVENFVGHGLTIKTKYGNISLHNIITKKLLVESEYGDISFDNSTIEEFDITTKVERLKQKIYKL